MDRLAFVGSASVRLPGWPGWPGRPGDGLRRMRRAATARPATLERSTGLRMVNLRKGYREEPKVGNNGFKTLQGKFVPQTSNYQSEMKLADEMENDFTADDDSGDDEFGSLAEREVRVGSSDESRSGAPGSTKKWSRRAEAAKKRWANPVYRAKMLETRRRKQQENKKKEARNKRLDLTCMDSIAHSPPKRAAEITAYARSIAQRRAKMLKYHHSSAEWMKERLEAGKGQRIMATDVELKKQRQQARSEIAKKRHLERKASLLKEDEGGGTEQTSPS